MVCDNAISTRRNATSLIELLAQAQDSLREERCVVFASLLMLTKGEKNRIMIPK